MRAAHRVRVLHQPALGGHAGPARLRARIGQCLRVIMLFAGLLPAMITQAAAPPAHDEPDMEAITRAIMSGELPRALQMIRAMEQAPPQDAGGWLDVAMLYCEAGEQDEAERLFRWIEAEFAPPPSIRQLIDYTRMLGCARKPATARPRWSFSYGLSAGFTDNVNSGPSQATIRLPDAAPVRELTLLPAYVARSDVFIGLEAAGEYALDADQRRIAIGSLRLRQYASEPQFSYQQLMAGVSAQYTLGQQAWDTVVAGSVLGLGGALFETSLNAQAGAWLNTSERNGRPVRTGIDLVGSVLQYPNSRSYDAMLLELRGKSQWQLFDHTMALGAAGLVADLSRHGRTGGDRHGFMLSLRSETRLDDTRQLNLHFQHYQLNDANTYNETLFGELKRSPASGFLSIRLQQKWNARDSVYVQLTRNWRDDTIPLFRMGSTVLLVGYQWQ